MDITLADILIFSAVTWVILRLITLVRDANPDGEAIEYVKERIEGMEFELEHINGVWYCWILEDKVYTFVGQDPDRLRVEAACKQRVHDMCVKGLTG